MNIAIIAPSPVPYTIGGAEKFWWGLHKAINQYSIHQAELIKLPSPENKFLDLMDSYYKFSQLDLSHFDMVVSSKYPAWMVEHPNHHCYMVHRLRGLYDTYHFTGLPLEIENCHPELTTLQVLLESTQYQRSELDLFWNEWQKIKELIEKGIVPEDQFAFPGPLTRKIIHFLDNIALSSTAIQRFSAISHNLVKRTDYFPENSTVHVIHPPSDVENFKSDGKTERDYIFTISRLDQPKRIDLLIEAFKQTSVDIDFRIAGSGPQEQRLRKLAEGDERIKFLGRITDDQALEEYAGALFIPFIPYDEDYGLITIESMKSRKAVLTTTDAGGVNEFVENGVSGYSVEPSVAALASSMDNLFANPDNTRQMGINALDKVAHVNWPTVVKHLLEDSHSAEKSLPENQEKKPLLNRKKIVVVLTFSVYPPRGGGQSRAYNIYREIAREHDVTLVILTDQEKQKKEQQQNIQYQELLIAPNMREIRVSKSKRQLIYEHNLFKQLGTPVEDIACIEGYKLTPQFAEVLSQTCQNADLVISCHPFLFYTIQEVWNGPVWYEAQDVEVDVKQAIIGDHPAAGPWIEKTRKIEADCCLFSEKIFTCSEKDAQRITEIYQQPENKLKVIANGVDMRIEDEISDQPKNLLEDIKSLNFIGNKWIVLFMGSWHGPNIEAMEHIKSMAPNCPQATFILLGSVCEHPSCRDLPENVISLGMVPETEKNLYLQLADLALNPIVSGSGTNLKMLDYTAKKLPVLSTPFGLRGLTFIPDQEVFSAEIENFQMIINKFSDSNDSNQLREMAEKAYNRTQNEYSWEVIAKDLLLELK